MGFVLAGLTMLSAARYTNPNREKVVEVLSGSEGGFVYISLVLFTVILTNIRLRNLVSAVLAFCVVILCVVLAWLGVLSDLPKLLPRLEVHMTAGFYLLMSTGILAIWLLSFFALDRFAYWKVSEGKLEEVSLFRVNGRVFDLRDVTVSIDREEALRHAIFGLGSADLNLRVDDESHESIRIENVLNAASKVRIVREIQARSIYDVEASVEPESTVPVEEFPPSEDIAMVSDVLEPEPDTVVGPIDRKDQ